MRRFRTLATRTAPVWVLLWLVASLNFLDLCCTTALSAGSSPSDTHAHQALAAAHAHARMPAGHPCTVSLAKQGIPLLPATKAPAFPDETAVFVLPAGWPALQPRLPRALPRPVHGPPPNHRLAYLHTLRLRI